MYRSELLGTISGSTDKAEDGLSGELVGDNTQDLIHQLAKLSENIIVKEQFRANGREYLVSVRTPAREVAVAMVDEHGQVQLFKNMLDRAVGEGLLNGAKLESGLRDLGDVASLPAHGAALMDVGNLSEQINWLGRLAQDFSH